MGKKLPEKVYLAECEHFDPFSWSIAYHEKDEVYNVEYVRSDIAEQMAKEFADYCLDQHCEYLLGHTNRKTTDELFTEFINSQKAQK